MDLSSVVLWLFVINLGIAFGAGLYEHRIVVSRWIKTSPDGGGHWNAEAARRDDTGRRFWAFVSTGPLTLLTLASLYAAWHAAGALHTWWLVAAVAALADRALTFGYFIPRMVALMRVADSPAAAGAALRWRSLNYLRLSLILVAWLASLQAFALFHAQAGLR